jgi:hypothetical protein
MIHLLILSFLFNGPQSFFQSSLNSGVPVKWSIQTNKNDPAIYNVIIDASKVNRFIQLGDLRFVADFKDRQGNLISRDSIWYFPKTAAQAGHISGTKVSSRTFSHSYGPDVKITGIKLLFVWDDTSMSMEPDPFGDKLIIENEIYGKGSADISDGPSGN